MVNITRELSVQDFVLKEKENRVSDFYYISLYHFRKRRWRKDKSKTLPERVETLKALIEKENSSKAMILKSF